MAKMIVIEDGGEVDDSMHESNRVSWFIRPALMPFLVGFSTEICSN